MSSSHRRRLSGFEPQQGAGTLAGDHIHKSVRALPHVANPLVQLHEHRLASNLFPLVVEHQPVDVTGARRFTLAQTADEEAALPLRKAIAGIPRREPISIRVGGLAIRPRIVLAGVDAPALPALASDTNLALAELGVEPESRAYSPHLTLARIKSRKGLEPLRKHVAESSDSDFGAFLAHRFFLYHSKPGASGSVYTKLSEFPFST